MSERRLVRALSLPEVLMLGTAGTVAAEIFVLTGHVAGMVGPASVLVLLVAGLLTYNMALNYAELATTYPVTGGALTYVRQAYGNGLLAFLVGSLDCLSSAFYAALSSVGFAYSLRVFLPEAPIVPTALMTAAVFTVLNILGVANVGRVQLVLGGMLLALLGLYVGLGLTRTDGFRIETLLPEGRLFVHADLRANVGAFMAAMALIFNAFVGFEIIADDAEEIRDYKRVIPIALLVSLTLITLTYVMVTLVTVGTVPWQELAGSETALAQAAARFLPRWGVPLMGLAGIIATLTSVNTAMLSATREALSLSRLGLWPRFMARLGRLRTPYAASLVIGVVVALTATIGLVDLLSYISSSGYLFVVFWASLAMVRLRRIAPQRERPFRAPYFPLTAYSAASICVLIVAFTAPRALAFGAGVLVMLTLVYWARPSLTRWVEEHDNGRHGSCGRILVPVAHPQTANDLLAVAITLAERTPGMTVSVLSVILTQHPLLSRRVKSLVSRWGRHQIMRFRSASQMAYRLNVPFSTHVRLAQTVWDGIRDEIEALGDVRLLLMGWPGPLDPASLSVHPVTRALQEGHTDVGVLLDRGGGEWKRILVPYGGGVHAKLALRTAIDLASSTQGEVVVLRCLCDVAADVHDELLMVCESFDSELAEIPDFVSVKVIVAPSVPQGVLQEVQAHRYDLVVMGAAVAASLHTNLFGSMTESIAQQIPYSVLLVRRYEPLIVNWIRRRVKTMVPSI
jgi:amino acid transporter/nucleotide-binding universal stress UspA family protein